MNISLSEDVQVLTKHRMSTPGDISALRVNKQIMWPTLAALRYIIDIFL